MIKKLSSSSRQSSSPPGSQKNWVYDGFNKVEGDYFLIISDEEMSEEEKQRAFMEQESDSFNLGNAVIQEIENDPAFRLSPSNRLSGKGYFGQASKQSLANMP